MVSSTESHDPSSRPTVESPMSPVFGVRPTAASTSSASTSVPSSSSKETGPPSDTRAAAVTLTPIRTSTPASRNPEATSSPANGGSRSSNAPRDTSVTRDPSADQAAAISHPTTPPPTITSRAGTAFALVASRLVHGRTPASTGGTNAPVPVATQTACRAESVTFPTVTSRSPASRACPRTREIFAELSQETWPSSFQSCVKESRRASTSAGSSRAPETPRTAAASATTPTGRSKALLGMHAQ